jgi:hypothetical protein
VRSLGEFAGRAQPEAGPAGPGPSPPWSGRSGRTSQAGASPLPAVPSVVAHPLAHRDCRAAAPRCSPCPRRARSAAQSALTNRNQVQTARLAAATRSAQRAQRGRRTSTPHNAPSAATVPPRRQTKPLDQSGSSADKLIAVPRAPGQSREHAQQAIEQQTARGDHHHNRRHPRPTRRQPRPRRPIQHVPPGRAPTTTVPRPPPRHPYPSQSSGNACSHTVSREPSSGPKLNA